MNDAIETMREMVDNHLAMGLKARMEAQINLVESELRERDEINYKAGFDNGLKACLQILDGYLDYPHSALENIMKWVDEQWKEVE